jgi:hypothetical protein
LRSQTARALELALPSRWAEAHRRLDGKPYHFRGREFLREIHDDTASNVSIRKANQIGGSEAITNVALCDVDGGISTMYVLPTERVRDRHVAARFNPMMRASPDIMAMFEGADNVRVKSASNAALYFEGSNSKAGAHSVPVGSLIIDEVDRCVASALPEFEKRLSGQAHPRVRAISTPTFPGRGVDALFESSDGRFWTIRCPACRSAGTLDWDDAAIAGFPAVVARVRWDGWPETRFTSVDVRQSAAASGRLECCSCGHVWTDPERKAAVSAGEWVALHPTREAHGYHVPQILSPVRTVAQLVADLFRSTSEEDSGARPGALRTWHNGARGMPYLSATERIERAEVEALVGDVKRPDDAIVCAGIDVGTWKHVCIGTIVGGTATWEFLKLKGFDDVVELLRVRHVASACIDALPEKEAVEKLCEAFEGVVYRVYGVKGQSIAVAWDDENRIARISRVSLVASVNARIRAKAARIARTEQTAVACDHLTRVTIVEGVSKSGEPGPEVAKLSAEDHYYWAALYLECALRRVRDAGGTLELAVDKGFGQDAVTEFAGPRSARRDRLCGVRDLGDEGAFTEIDDGGFGAW